MSRFWSDETGATAVEYGIIVGVLSLALIAIFKDAQTIIYNVIVQAATKVEAAGG